MDAIGSSLSGIQASLARFDASAQRVASASAGFQPTAPQTGEQLDFLPQAVPGVDFVNELAEQLTARLTYDANLTVLKSADEMQQSLIHRWA